MDVDDDDDDVIEVIEEIIRPPSPKRPRTSADTEVVNKESLKVAKPVKVATKEKASKASSRQKVAKRGRSQESKRWDKCLRNRDGKEAAKTKAVKPGPISGTKPVQLSCQTCKMTFGASFQLNFHIKQVHS